MSRNFFLTLALTVAFLCGCVFAQEQSPLGDVARQQRKANVGTAPHAAHVITNEDIPQKTDHPSAKSLDKSVDKPPDEDATDSADDEDASDQESTDGKTDTTEKDKWLKNVQAAIRKHKRYIAALKDHLAYLQKQAADLNLKPDGTAYSCGGSDALYREVCGNIRRLQAAIEQTKAQIESAQRELEQAQEEIRKRGYGNAIYDPD